LTTFNHDTFAHDLLRLCGGTNVFADRDGALGSQGEPDSKRTDDMRYPRVTLAEIEAAQPDVILLPGERFPVDERHGLVFASLDVPAIQSGRIHLIDRSLLTWHGTRMARALNTLPALLCTDIDRGIVE
jgi:ABC-type Fe3+-hydroxamate transport system substrate-binding protein